MKNVSDCLVSWCGRIPYADAYAHQLMACECKRRGMEEDVLLLLEHPPVVTMGRSADKAHLLADASALEKRGVELHETDRGGDVTFHGPGQLVGYPIVSLRKVERDVRAYMRRLEESLIRLLAVYNIPCERDTGYTGVWTDSGKIAAMGVHISRWITRHGFALNVNTDLSFFDMIVPCGIVGKGVTSMQKLRQCNFDVQSVAERYIQEFGYVFNRRMIPISKQELIQKMNVHIKNGNEPVQAGSGYSQA